MSSKKYCHSLNTYIKNLLIFFVNNSFVSVRGRISILQRPQSASFRTPNTSIWSLVQFFCLPISKFLPNIQEIGEKRESSSSADSIKGYGAKCFSFTRGVPLKDKCSIEFRFEHTSGPMFSIAFDQRKTTTIIHNLDLFSSGI